MPTPLTAILQLPLLPPEAKIRGVVIHRRRCVPPDFRRYLQRERSAPSGHPEKQPPGERGSPQHPPPPLAPHQRRGPPDPPDGPHATVGDPSAHAGGPPKPSYGYHTAMGDPQNLPVSPVLL